MATFQLQFDQFATKTLSTQRIEVYNYLGFVVNESCIQKLFQVIDGYYYVEHRVKVLGER